MANPSAGNFLRDGGCFGGSSEGKAYSEFLQKEVISGRFLRWPTRDSLQRKRNAAKKKTIAANKKVNAANKKVNAANKKVIAANKKK